MAELDPHGVDHRLERGLRRLVAESSAPALSRRQVRLMTRPREAVQRPLSSMWDLTTYTH